MARHELLLCIALLIPCGMARAAETPLAMRQLINGTNLAGFATWLEEGL